MPNLLKNDSVQSVLEKSLTPSEAVRLLDRAARKMEPRIARAFLLAMERVRDRVNAEELALLIARGDAGGVLRLLQLEQVPEDLAEFKAAIGEAVTEGARIAADNTAPVEGVDGRIVRFVFDQQNPRLANFAQQISSTRIREIDNDVREVTRTIIADGAVQGNNPRETAIRVRDSIGLTAKQSAAVARCRQELEDQAYADAANRSLMHGTDRNTIRGRKSPLSQAQIDKMVDRYRARYVKYRSEVIARTESIRSLNGAQRELYQSYIDEGRLSPRQIQREWIFTNDGRTRNGHRQIPEINGSVGWDEPFQSIVNESIPSTIMYPGDPNALPGDTVNCRCTVFNRIIPLGIVDRRK